MNRTLIQTLTQTLTQTAVLAIVFGIGACASAPVRSSALGPSLGSSISSSVAELAADEEDADEWQSDCRQELGSDSGDAQRAHLISMNEWVSGCFVNGDDVDAFVLEVPTESTYQIELIHRGGGPIEATLLSADGVDIARDALVEGAHLSRSLSLAPGSRIRVAKAPGESAAWYRFRASPVTTIATK